MKPAADGPRWQTETSVPPAALFCLRPVLRSVLDRTGRGTRAALSMLAHPRQAPHRNSPRFAGGSGRKAAPGSTFGTCETLLDAAV